MNYPNMSMEQFLKQRKLKVGEETKEEVTQNEKMFWEYNELMKHLTQSDYFYSTENKFLAREGQQFNIKEIHLACLDVCDSPQANTEILNFQEGICLRNCLGKFHNWMREQYQATRANSLGKFIMDGMESKRRAQQGFKPKEELEKRVEELEKKINWDEVNKHIY